MPSGYHPAPFFPAIERAGLRTPGLGELAERQAGVALLAAYERVLEVLGKHALPACRQLVERTPLPHAATLDARGNYTQVNSPKRVALQTIRAHGNARDDSDRLWCLLRSQRETEWDRVNAGQVLHSFLGAEALDDIAPVCFEAQTKSDAAAVVAAKDLAGFGPDFLPYLLPRLAGGDYDTRRQAALAIREYGRDAVDGLVELIRTTTHQRALDKAEQLLGLVDRRALRRARQARREETRRISIVHDEPPDRRGISRTDEPQRE